METLFGWMLCLLVIVFACTIGAWLVSGVVYWCVRIEEHIKRKRKDFPKRRHIVMDGIEDSSHWWND